ncbi:MAG: hypothetical protein AB8H79_26110, partial [Myxococcota bacterium]
VLETPEAQRRSRSLQGGVGKMQRLKVMVHAAVNGSSRGVTVRHEAGVSTRHVRPIRIDQIPTPVHAYTHW